MPVDFEREGLLEDCSSESDRQARSELLSELLDQGVPLEDLKRAVSERRLTLLPAERRLMGEPRYTIADLARESGLDQDALVSLRRALGMADPDPDDRVMTEEDLEAARSARRFADAGVDQESILDVARVMGQAMEGVAESSRQAMGDALLRPDDSEPELARRLAAATETLTPIMGELLEFHYRVRLREGLRSGAVVSQAPEAGEPTGSVEIAVVFADLVGFTRLGERLPASDVGRVAGRLAELAGDVAGGGVQLVKTIGDAAMLVSREPEPLVRAALDLVDAADAEGEDFPQLHAGAANGPALPRAGDWYGRPVNLASRVAGVARPGSVLATRDLREALREGSPDDGSGHGESGAEEAASREGDGQFLWSRAPARRLKGIEGRVALYRVRRARSEEDAAGEA